MLEWIIGEHSIRAISIFASRMNSVRSAINDANATYGNDDIGSTRLRNKRILSHNVYKASTYGILLTRALYVLRIFKSQRHYFVICLLYLVGRFGE